MGELSSMEHLEAIKRFVNEQEKKHAIVPFQEMNPFLMCRFYPNMFLWR